MIDYKGMWGKLRNCLDELSVCVDDDEAYLVNFILNLMDNIEYNGRKELGANK